MAPNSFLVEIVPVIDFKFTDLTYFSLKKGVSVKRLAIPLLII